MYILDYVPIGSSSLNYIMFCMFYSVTICIVVCIHYMVTSKDNGLVKPPKGKGHFRDFKNMSLAHFSNLEVLYNYLPKLVYLFMFCSICCSFMLHDWLNSFQRSMSLLFFLAALCTNCTQVHVSSIRHPHYCYSGSTSRYSLFAPPLAYFCHFVYDPP